MGFYPSRAPFLICEREEGRGRWRPPFLSLMRRERQEGPTPPFLSLGPEATERGAPALLWAGVSLPLAH